MLIKTDGLVIKEQNVGESDRLITVLTSDYGLIRAFVRRAKSVKSNLVSSTQLLSYSDFVFFQGKDSFSVNSAQVKNLFFDLRSDIDNMSTAFYLCELFSELAPEETNAEGLLKLLLNSLYLLNEKKRDWKLVKAVAELRGLSESGYMPDLVACQECGEFETGVMYFDPQHAHLYCSEHGKGKGIPMSISSITAMRYIIYSEPKKIFDFTLTDAALKELCTATEIYALETTGRHYKTLEFLKSLQTM